MTKKTKKNNKGFSLVELIIVIAIMAILAGVLAPQFIKYLASSRKTSDIENAKMIGEAVAAQIANDAAVGNAKFNNGSSIEYDTDYSFKGGAQKVSTQDIQDVVGGNVTVKAAKGYEFYVESKAGGTVEVSVKGTTGDAVVLYPSVAPGSAWATSEAGGSKPEGTNPEGTNPEGTKPEGTNP